MGKFTKVKLVLVYALKIGGLGEILEGKEVPSKKKRVMRLGPEVLPVFKSFFFKIAFFFPHYLSMHAECKRSEKFIPF